MTSELHPSVAATDLLLVITAFLSIKRIGLENRYVVVGFSLMALAALLGIFRFGISLNFLLYHHHATRISTQIGFPLMSLGVFFARTSRKNSLKNLLIDGTILIVLFSIFNFVWQWKPYEDIIGVVSSVFMVYYGIRNQDQNILKAVALFTFGGLVVTGSLVPSGIPGLLNADLFHIIVCGAIMMISRSIHHANQNKLK